MRRTKEDAEQTRENILEAAACIFTEKGVAKTTLSDVAKAANVTRGAIYWHFKNKVEIFDALHDQLHRPLVDLILEDVKKNHPEPLVQLRDLCINLLIDLDQNDQKKRVLTLFLMKCDYAGDLEHCKEKHNQKKQEKLKAFARYFEKAKEQGALCKEADPELLTRSISCYMRGIIAEYLDNPDDFNMKVRAPQMLQLFFRNLYRVE